MDDINIAKIIGNSTYSESLERINKIINNIPDIPHVPIPEQLIDNPAITEAQRIAKELSENIASLPSLSDIAQNILPEITYSLPKYSAFKAGTSVLSSIDIINASTAAISSLDRMIHNQDNELCVDLPEPLAELISTIDNSVILPESNSEKIVQVKESSCSITFWNVISLIIGIISIAIAIYSDYSGTTLENQHHAERMQEEQKQTDLLRQIEENTSSNPEEVTEPVESSTRQLL